MKRKTLGNNLRAGGWRPEVVESACQQCAVQTQARAEAVSLEAMACLFRAIAAD